MPKIQTTMLPPMTREQLVDQLERIATSKTASASSKVRALELLLRQSSGGDRSGAEQIKDLISSVDEAL